MRTEIPNDLTRHKRWILFQPDKAPRNANGQKVGAGDKSHWMEYEEALVCSTHGVGFSLGENDTGLICVDLDGCVDPITGDLSPRTAA